VGYPRRQTFLVFWARVASEENTSVGIRGPAFGDLESATRRIALATFYRGWNVQIRAKCAFRDICHGLRSIVEQLDHTTWRENTSEGVLELLETTSRYGPSLRKHWTLVSINVVEFSFFMTDHTVTSVSKSSRTPSLVFSSTSCGQLLNDTLKPWHISRKAPFGRI